MAVILQVSPLDSHWLLAKITGLLVYIVLGAVALTYGRGKLLKRICFMLALAVFAYVVAVAHTAQVAPWQNILSL